VNAGANVYFLSLSVALMTLLFGDGLLKEHFNLPPDVIQLLSYLMIAALTVGLIFFSVAGTFQGYGGDHIFGTVFTATVLFGFSFDIVTTMIGAEQLFRGTNQISQYWSIGFAIMFTLFIFVITMPVERWSRSGHRMYVLYIAFFASAMIFDFITSVVGMFELIGVEDYLQIQAFMIYFLSGVVILCQFFVFKIFVIGQDVGPWDY